MPKITVYLSSEQNLALRALRDNGWSVSALLQGAIERQMSVTVDPDALVERFRAHGNPRTDVAEYGPLSKTYDEALKYGKAVPKARNWISFTVEKLYFPPGTQFA